MLIDPGLFSFIEGRLRPEEIGAVDVILYTHKHADHFDPASLKVIAGLQAAVIVTHPEVGRGLEEEGFSYTEIRANESLEIAGFRISAHNAPHENIPGEVPHNLAFVINQTLLHPGDSFTVENTGNYPVLALPVAAPWARITDALQFAYEQHPQHVIPIHDGYIKDFMLERMYRMCQLHLEKKDMAFHPLKLHESFTV